MEEMNLKEEIYHCALQCGFDNCGIISIDGVDGFKELLDKRISDVPHSKFFYDNAGNKNNQREM